MVQDLERVMKIAGFLDNFYTKVKIKLFLKKDIIEIRYFFDNHFRSKWKSVYIKVKQNEKNKDIIKSIIEQNKTVNCWSINEILRNDKVIYTDPSLL